MDDPVQLASLALFHTEAGMGRRTFGRFAEDTPNILNFGGWGLDSVFEAHSFASYQLIERLVLRAKRDDDDGLLDFTRSWYSVAVSYCARWDLPHCVDGLLEKAEHYFGTRDPELLLLLGAVRTPRFMTRSRIDGIPYHDLIGQYQEPQWAFQRAPSIDPMLVEARVRLGQILVILNDPDAPKELERALEDARGQHHLFAEHLAALFLGEFTEPRGDLEAAITFYQAAVDAYRAHTASVANRSKGCRPRISR